MTTPPDGGPAFPHPETVKDVTLEDGRKAARVYPSSVGMSLRAYIATAALQGLSSHAHSEYITGPCNQALVDRAVILADALIAELSK
jgi:hypothetical protein